jgi:trehalose 6-phosphate phosphatase
MRYLLSRASRPVLTRLARERTLCAFDFDGTLAPITVHPDRAAISDRTRTLLCQVASLYPCAIVSGRARADVLRKLHGVGVERVFGNHGAESGTPQPRVRKLVSGWMAAFEPLPAAYPGVWVEDKGLSLAVHYRQSADKLEARRAIVAAAQKLDNARLLGGKQVVNVVVQGAPGKREAVAAVRDRLHCSAVLFVGDDENDEGAFALEGETVAVRVGRKKHSRARYYLRTQAEMDRLLELLISLRRGASEPERS